MKEIRRQLAFLTVLLIAMAIVLIIAGAFPLPSAIPPIVVQSAGPQQQQTSAIPPLTPEVQAQLAASHGFQMLVSYTNQGFQPTSATIKKGDTIRFTNNSSHDLWIAASGTSANPVYPGSSDCGATALDTCKSLKPGDFWEFTFTKSGTWGYQNNLQKNDIGTVQVK
jgi:plastocyanin